MLLSSVAALVAKDAVFLTRTKDQSITPQDRKGGKAKIGDEVGEKN